MQITQKSNPSNKPWLVLKFGGTSVGKFLNQITEVIVKGALETHRVVVVCSARSNDVKSKGTTSRLIHASEEVLHTGSKSHLSIVQDILEDHIEAVNAVILNPDIRQQVIQELTAECRKLQAFLTAAEVINEVSPRSKDIIIGCGEKLACIFVAAALKDKYVDAQYVSLERIVDKHFEAGKLDQSFYDYLAERFAASVEDCENRVPVVTGYFGSVPGGILHSIGRGYTDLTAALCAVGLQAEELQVWKEVDGIFTADPRKVPTARLLNIITPEEAAELTYYGSEVIHPFTMEQVIRAQIPIRIKNVQNPAGNGTIIFPDSMSSKGGSPPPAPKFLLENGYQLDLSRRHPTAVTIKDNVVVLNIHSNRKSVSHGFLANIFSTLDRFGIIVDLISTSEVHVSMALSATLLDHNLEGALAELGKLGRVDVLRQMAILSLVGKQMRNMVGISGLLFATLAEAHVNIEMISQGSSEINISCVIEERKSKEALVAIHNTLIEKTNHALLAE
ncbi:aspartate kinase [Basidiobolus meristosporus CBS 931.73]|uniref:Aspartokinase n=1 Tax=Basidiobolus meristosporus CBS 931.73 TaxID=1314790 RepID=A0A1Y1X736_9FUNG|nr:aspartate kinase [Basidiobolus meristosporus CBS 931.73]|eukprot:ORX81577.1 aspartate kinase [Basidiobolus meristosporus CBS 931.73]